MPAEGSKRSLQRFLVDRILKGPGQASAGERAQAFADADVPEPLRPLLDKVARGSAEVSDADFSAATEAGFTDDQLFELVICAAVGASTRQYETALSALAAAFTGGETG